MNILVANDDGIEAEGLRKLAEALSEVGDVYVSAPMTQQSAKAHGITIGKSIRIKKTSLGPAAAAIALDGTPADCVKIGIEYYKNAGIEMDMVFAGINHGMNLGTDTLYSGTVGAAMEGAICGLPSAAVSLAIRRSNDRKPIFDFAQKLAVKAARLPLFQTRVADKNPKDIKDPKESALGVDFIYRDHVVLNINVPDLPEEELAGVKVAPLSYREYEEWFVPGEEGDEVTSYHYSGRPNIAGDFQPDDSDVIANSLNYATVTPLQFDLTNFKLIDELRREW
ncbi:MAG: 5'/3'-nucleotidase SurE [Clostridiales Family XIII bacterium]|jgi:5'-nucleotidase|nr:5'/3'-nucleotidase SurE [Clostridiales Family XIII bacterium]